MALIKLEDLQVGVSNISDSLDLASINGGKDCYYDDRYDDCDDDCRDYDDGHGKDEDKKIEVKIKFKYEYKYKG
jgi:hypothetical protein